MERRSAAAGRGGGAGFGRDVLLPAAALAAALGLLAACGWRSPARAQQTAAGRDSLAGAPAAAGSPSQVSADRLVERRIDGQKVRFLYGNVVIDRDTLVARADTAEDHVVRDLIILMGDVRLTSRGADLTCRRAEYRRAAGSADFFGDILLVDGTTTGTGLRGEFRQDGRHLRLIGQARLDTPEQTVLADTIYQDRRLGVSMALGRVRILEKSVRAAADTAAPASPADTLAAAAPADTAAAVASDTTGVRPRSLTCRRAVFRTRQDESDFFGDVVVDDGELRGAARRAEVRQGERIFRLVGDALLVAPDYTIRADVIEQDRDTGLGDAAGHVRILDPQGGSMVGGDHAVFDRGAQTAVVDRNPVLTSREQGGRPLTGTALRMVYQRDQDRLVMVDSVRITQDRTTATADSAVAYGRSRMVLMGSPSVDLDPRSRLTADLVEFHYAEGDLQRVRLLGSAVMKDQSPDSLAAIYRGLPAIDELKGDTITIDFSEGRIERTTVVGAATSHYTPLDVTEEIVTNDVAGDSMVIHFRDSKVRRVEVFGEAAGTYRFAKIAAMGERRELAARLDSLLSAPGAQGIAAADSVLLAQVDSLAARLGLAQVAAALAAGPEPARRDSLLGAALDSLRAAGRAGAGGGLDFTATAEKVDYEGTRVQFDLGEESMEIWNKGKLVYGTMVHTADHIRLDTATRELYSEGEPFLKDSESVAGQSMGYNFKYKTGAVRDGVTSFDGYYYVGRDIRRYPDTTMKIHGGQMTSCDQAVPHYHFWSNNMKMRTGDKVVAAPIVLKIGHVPVFALPFYYKSLKEGRQSGILFPSFDFGWSSREGRYIRDFGYYWATNDYLDLMAEGDYNEKQDFSLRLSNRYVKRYAFNGSIDYSRQNSLREGDDTREWQLRWDHNQPALLDDYKLRAEVRLSSASLSSNDLSGSNRRDIVSGQMKSNVYLSRNWSFLSANLNATRDGRVNAEDDDPATDNLLYTLTLPSLSLSFRQFTLAPSLRSGQHGSMIGDLLRNTYVQHSYTMRSDRKANELTDVTTYNASGKASVSVRPPRVGIFNFSLSANGGQDWSRQTTEGSDWVADTDSTGHFADVYQRVESTRPSLSFSSNLGTTLYGLFPVNLGRLRTIRHTTKMNAAWSLTPGLPGKQTHNTSVALSWSNRLDAKYLSASGDSLAERKLDGLVDWTLSTTYSPKQEPGERWGDISSGLTVKPGQSRYLQLKVSNSIDPKTLALKSTRFNYALSFNGRLDTGAAADAGPQQASLSDRLGLKKDAAAEPAPDAGAGLNAAAAPLSGGQDDAFAGFQRAQQRQGQQGGSGPDDTDGGRIIPFTINTSISYSYTNASRDKRANANFALTAGLTRNWEFRYDTSFDLAEGTAVRQQFSLNRELHCWRLEFTRTVSAVDSQFGFRLYLKAIPALKFVRGREDDLGGFQNGMSGMF